MKSEIYISVVQSTLTSYIFVIPEIYGLLISRKLKLDMNIVLLEGNIACGKTTFLKKIFENQCIFKGRNIQIIEEPVSRWTDSQAGNLLNSATTGAINSSLFQVGISFVFSSTIFCRHL